MKKRMLGSLAVSTLGLGCMGMSPQYYGARDEHESLQTLHYALDHGVSIWDTANVYGGVGVIMKNFYKLMGSRAGLPGC